MSGGTTFMGGRTSLGVAQSPPNLRGDRNEVDVVKDTLGIIHSLSQFNL